MSLRQLLAMSFMVLFFSVNIFNHLSVLPVKGNSGIKVQSKCYLNYDENAVYVVGEVINGFENTISEVNVTVTFYNETELIKEFYTSVFLSVIPPGRRAAFKLMISLDEVAGFSNYTAQLLSYKSSNQKPPGISIVSAKAVLYEDRTEVTGYIKNVAPNTIYGVNIFALLYDENGFIGVTDSDLTIFGLEPGDTASFKCITWLINSTFNVSKVIITGESLSYSVMEEKILISGGGESVVPDFRIITIVVVTIVILISLVLFRKKLFKKKKKKHFKEKLLAINMVIYD